MKGNFTENNAVVHGKINGRLDGNKNIVHGKVTGNCTGNNNTINGKLKGDLLGSNNVVESVKGDIRGHNNIIRGKFKGTDYGINNRIGTRNARDYSKPVTANTSTCNTMFMGGIINTKGMQLSSPKGVSIMVMDDLITSPSGTVLVNGDLEYKTPVKISDIQSGEVMPISKDPIPAPAPIPPKLTVPPYDAKNDVTATGDEDQCNVCMDLKKACAFVPCGHQLCHRCVNELYLKKPNGTEFLKCPTCIQDCNIVIKLFY